MNVLGMPAAMADLAEVRDFIAADNPDRAVSFVTEILNAGDTIADMPRAFPLEPGLEHKHVRRRVYGRYSIFYRIERGQIEILHVAHSARDYIRSLFGML